MDLKRRFFAVLISTVLSSSLYAQSPGAPTWKIYYDSAQSFWNKDWKRTISLLTRAEKSAVSDLGIYDENYLTIVNDLGLAYAKAKDYSSAEKLFTRIIGIRTELGNTTNSEFVNTTINLSGIYADQGKVQKAATTYKKLLSQPSTLEPQDYRRVAGSLIHLYESTNHLDSALLLSEKLKAAAGNDEEITTELTLTQGRLKRKLRRYQESKLTLEGLEHSLQQRTEANLHLFYTRTIQELGLLSVETGSLNDAERYLLQCFRLLKSSQTIDNQLLIEVLNNLASTYERLNINDKALAYYHDALDLCQKVKGTNDISTLTIKSNIAGILLRQGDLAQAIASYEEISRTMTTIPQSREFYITVLNNLSTAYRKNNQYARAKETLGEATKQITATNMDKEDLAAVILNNIAVLHAAQGEAEKAISYFEQAYAIKKTLYGENSVSLMELTGNMAVVYWALRKPELAIPLFRKANAMAIRQIKYTFPNLSENEQIQFYQRTKEDFERFNAVAFQTTREHPELLKDVFNNQVVLKSILFFTQQHRQILINEKRDSLLSKQYDLLRSKREQLGQFYRLPLKDLSTAETSATSLEKEIESLEKSVSLKTSETIAEKMMEMEIHWDQIQKAMTAEQALIEIIRCRKYDFKTFVENNADRVRFGFTDSVYYAALVTTKESNASPQLVQFKDGNNMESRFLNYYRNALTFDVDDQNSYSSYWKPLEPHLSNKTKLYISGDGVYHRLNLNTLRASNSDQYLIQRFDIHYLLNPGQFIQEKAKRSTSKKAVLVGDPLFDTNTSSQSATAKTPGDKFQQLPGTQKEVTKINEILKTNGWSTNTFLQSKATEKNVKAVHSPDLLHIATHGFFSVDKVRLNAEVKKDFLFYSGLVFAGVNNTIDTEKAQSDDDGILTAFEVMNLDLSSTSLVVLSACETGLGKIENGEGVYGLQRSFLQAGARNIIISLWKVDDLLTQELMIKFYQHLFKGHDARTALKLAQIDQLKKRNNPFDWGGFIIVGTD